MKTFSEMLEFETFEERFRYLQCTNGVGSSTLGSLRWIAEEFYRTKEWKDLRKFVIVRDSGCDLAMFDRPLLNEKGIIHHIKPLTAEDFTERTMFLLDPDFMVLTSQATHNAIHYGDEGLLQRSMPIVRSRNDTSPWRMEDRS